MNCEEANPFSWLRFVPGINRFSRHISLNISREMLQNNPCY